MTDEEYIQSLLGLDIRQGEIDAILEIIGRVKAENAALKERLDKAVELPVKVGDIVYCVEDEDGDYWVKLNRNVQLNNFTIATVQDILHKACFFGLGRWTRGNTECCLLATKGKPHRENNSVSQLIFAPLTKHSSKPLETRERIKTLMGGVHKQSNSLQENMLKAGTVGVMRCNVLCQNA